MMIRSFTWAPALLALVLTMARVSSAGTGSAAIDRAVLEITALEDQRDPTPALHAYLRDKRPEVRARAALAVGRIGIPEDSAVLAPLLRDGDAAVRRAAAFGLGEIEDSTAAEPLVSLLRKGKESDAEVRRVAVEGLGKLRAGASACRRALRDPDARVREQALLAAWQIPVSDVLPEVLAKLEDDRRVRWAAAYCLMRLMGAPASGATPIARTAGLTAAERDTATKHLLGLLSDADPDIRHHAARGLSSVLTPEVTQALRALASDTDWRVRVEAVRALATQRPEGEEPRGRNLHAGDFAPFLADTSLNVVITAAESIGKAAPPGEAKPVIVGLLQHANQRVQEVAFDALAALWRKEPRTPALTDEVDGLCKQVALRDSWVMRARVPDAADLLSDQACAELLPRLVGDDARVVKVAVGPFLRHRLKTNPDAAAKGIWAALATDVTPLLGAEDAIVRYMTLSGISELFLADSLAHPTKDDWKRLEEELEAAYESSEESDDLTDVRQAVVDIASNWLDRPRMASLVRGACNDPSYVVRRAAVTKLRDAGATPPHEAEPIETGRTALGYRHILEWAATDHWAVWETEAGRIVAKLFSKDAPLTVWNFAELANGGYYDGGAWHRVVPNFVFQDGCPRGDGWGGPAWNIRCEVNPHRYETGRLGMALSGKDTGGSQYFFTHSPQPHLDGRYTIFGEIVSGHEVGDRIVQGMHIRSVRVVDDRP
jgi:cyclophilin family peptidyl-prolyl cis-trans isomerase